MRYGHRLTDTTIVGCVLKFRLPILSLFRDSLFIYFPRVLLSFERAFWMRERDNLNIASRIRIVWNLKGKRGDEGGLRHLCVTPLEPPLLLSIINFTMYENYEYLLSENAEEAKNRLEREGLMGRGARSRLRKGSFRKKKVKGSLAKFILCFVLSVCTHTPTKRILCVRGLLWLTFAIVFWARFFFANWNFLGIQLEKPVFLFNNNQKKKQHGNASKTNTEIT